ncbi:MAG: (2Fe-2S)-binding protein [Acidimicrobiales bacterium]
MYICHCNAVTDASIRSAIDGGARTIDEVSARCRAGTGCGGCWPALFELLEKGLDLDERPTELATAVS